MPLITDMAELRFSSTVKLAVVHVYQIDHYNRKVIDCYKVKYLHEPAKDALLPKPWYVGLFCRI